jgi:class 3 adenylate cyclase
VKVCPNCEERNPERARFCLNCATRLGQAALTEERKVVTVLFCDLVGFTARSDRADPEDVKAALRPFHSRIKREIEVYGGTLDKFIGDAALGVFGSPVAHEDDPERAVRAALAIAEAIEELNKVDPSLWLALRTGINTGEAVVAYGTGPQIGEAVTGDVVNTASRLQVVPEHGHALLGRGRCLLALDSPGARGALLQARELFTRLGARPLVAEADDLLERASALR